MINHEKHIMSVVTLNLKLPNIAATINNTNKKVIFKNCAPIADSISE